MVPELLKTKYIFWHACAVGFLVALLSDSAASYGFGRCPKYPSMPKFNMSRALGQWYEVERSFYLPEMIAGCTTMEFRSRSNEDITKDNNYKYEVSVRMVNRITKSPNSYVGYAAPLNDKSSIMNFKFDTPFPDFIARFLPGSGRYQVLYTDYENFAILWSCGSLGSIGYADQIWVLGRENDFDVKVRSKIYDALKKLGLDPERLVLSKNKHCT